MLVRLVLSIVFGAAAGRWGERVVGLATFMFFIGLFLVLGIAFGDLRVVAIMAAVIVVVGLYLFRDRLQISITVIRLMLVALILGLFLWLRFIVQASPTPGS
jgi:hypothetical protein